MKSYKGKFTPRFPGKWHNPTNIIYRSAIELKYFTYFDLHSDVKFIASEAIVVPYFDPVSRKKRRYIVDLLVKFKDKYGKENTLLIEIKSHGEANPPKKQMRITEKHIRTVTTYATNNAKWEAAKQYASKRGWDFKVFTERQLN